MLFVLLNFHSLPSSDHFERFGAEMGWTARSLAIGQGFSSPFYPRTGPTALVPPLYPLLLAGVFKLFGVYTNAAAFVALALNSLFSALTAAVIFYGLRVKAGNRTALGAAWLWALYPYSVYYSAVYLWDCALTSLLFSCCFFLCVTRLPHFRRAGWSGYGLLAGLTVLSNPSVLPLLIVITLFAAWQRFRLRAAVLQRLVLVAACMCAVLSPWLIRNEIVLHQPLVLRDGFWGEFYAGNNGDTSHSNPDWTHPASSAREMQRYKELGEIRYMAEKRHLAIDHVRSHPAQFAEESLRRVIRYWTGFWSFSRHYLSDQQLDVPNVPFCTLLTALMLAGVWAMARSSRLAALPYAATFALFPIPYYLTHSSVDYRQPIEPIVVVSVVYGILWVRARYRARVAAGKGVLFAAAA